MRAKKLVFTVATVGLVLVSIELACQGAYRLIAGQFYHPDDLAMLAQIPSWEQPKPRALRGVMARMQRQPLHPYFGFVVPSLDPLTHGFASTEPVVQAENPNRVVIAITGGSVAGQLTLRIKTLLQEQFAVTKSGVEPIVVGLNAPGFKQPQQLLAVSYILSLGGHFDMVINVDGFNEIVLPIVDNYTFHTFPFFPRLWKQRLQLHSGEADPILVGQLAFLRQQAEQSQQRILDSLWRRSAVFGLLYRQRLASLRNRAIHVEQELIRPVDDVGTLETDGPYREYQNLQELYTDAAQVWLQSSVLLEQIANGSGFEYYHFLQPNQYVAGSKPLSREERERAWDLEHEYASHARDGYPHLIRIGDQLRREGVKYHDMTMLFRERTDLLYKDSCCHYNQTGVDLVARHIVKTVLAGTRLEKMQPR